MLILKNRFEEISRLLSDPEVVANREKFTQLSKEFSELEPIVICYEQIQKIKFLSYLQNLFYFLHMRMLGRGNRQIISRLHLYIS